MAGAWDDDGDGQGSAPGTDDVTCRRRRSVRRVHTRVAIHYLGSATPDDFDLRSVWCGVRPPCGGPEL